MLQRVAPLRTGVAKGSSASGGDLQARQGAVSGTGSLGWCFFWEGSAGERQQCKTSLSSAKRDRNRYLYSLNRNVTKGLLSFFLPVLSSCPWEDTVSFSLP